MKLVLPRATLEYIAFPISTSPIPPNVLTHEVAIVATSDQPSGWVTAAYIQKKVRVLIRASVDAEPGGDITLAPGVWQLWWRSESNPEYPVRPVGLIQVV